VKRRPAHFARNIELRTRVLNLPLELIDTSNRVHTTSAMGFSLRRQTSRSSSREFIRPATRTAWLTTCLIGLAFAVIGPACQAQSPILRVAAAADLQKAFQELIPLFEKETGAKVTPVFGSTGLLSKQAEEGAPFDLLFAANEKFIADLETKGKLVAGTRQLYAIGRLVIWTRKGRPHPATLTDLAQPTYRRIAIANPEHAPYGAAAREAMQKAGVWPKVEPRLVYGENVQQTLQYAQTGNAQAAVVALSLAIGADGAYTLIPDTLHTPIRQAAAVLRQSKNAPLARQFSAFVLSQKGQKIMQKYGFTLPRGKR
jgi:molybdate transport system substrate-binding protein